MPVVSYRTVYESPSPQDVYCYSPGLCRLNTGRMIATCDLGGPGVARLPGIKSKCGDYGCGNLGKLLVSDDHGETWRHRTDFPFYHARPFVAGNALYVLGHAGDLMIMRSDDGGDTWSKPVKLTSGQYWHQAPCAVDYRHGRIYLTMEQHLDGATWPGVAIVLMSAEVNTDLLQPESWRYSLPIKFSDVVTTPLPSVGIPFYPTGSLTPESSVDIRNCGDPCWLESHVLRIYDPSHTFYDPDDRSMMVMARLHSGMTNIGTILRGVDDGSTLHLETLKTPAGTPLVLVPLPGGQMKFHIIYDPVSRYYWLLSSQSTDSMTRPECLPNDRYGLPDNERHRLQLHFSLNLFDWCFAGLVADSGHPRQGRHYASMVIDGDSLGILSRSGDDRAFSAHNGNLITYHTIKNFRSLIY